MFVFDSFRKNGLYVSNWVLMVPMSEIGGSLERLSKDAGRVR